jgi:superfamily II DNA/RNA helicase
VLSAARQASHDESKLRRLDRLLRRIGEGAIVFTEYRDTLAHVRRRVSCRTIVLHGGLSHGERAAALRSFSQSRDAVLLATDAAAEGLNLHERCRLVVNLELPWNPMRLEQRIGRVDRIGQRRTVHAFHLIAANTGEVLVAGRLRQRIAAAAGELGASNPLESDNAAALLVIGGTESS